MLFLIGLQFVEKAPRNAQLHHLIDTERPSFWRRTPCHKMEIHFEINWTIENVQAPGGIFSDDEDHT